jgi:hypothetical protein
MMNVIAIPAEANLREHEGACNQQTHGREEEPLVFVRDQAVPEEQRDRNRKDERCKQYEAPEYVHVFSLTCE